MITRLQAARATSYGVDDVVVQRFLDGDRSLNLNSEERRAVIDHYTTHDRPLVELERAGWNPYRTLREAS